MLYLKTEPKESQHSEQLSQVNPHVYSVTVPAIYWYENPAFSGSVGQLCYTTELQRMSAPQAYIVCTPQFLSLGKSPLGLLYLIVSLVLCIFIRVCSKEKQQLFSQLKSKWPHHFFEKRKIVIGLESFGIFGDHLMIHVILNHTHLVLLVWTLKRMHTIAELFKYSLG